MELSLLQHSQNPESRSARGQVLQCVAADRMLVERESLPIGGFKDFRQNILSEIIADTSP
jgi:hypothetical protein